MSRRKGELSNAGIDRQWPHQVALKAPLGKRLPEILEFCRRRDAAPRQPSFRRGDEDWVCIAFKDEADAQEFLSRFGGHPMDPKDRPKWPG
jgi:hypothetical protein